jgi:DNA-binding Lrp family transcriptional regulator
MSNSISAYVQPIPKQRFTGYWIPVELTKLGLTKTEQFLLSMIDSLESDAPAYCFARNSYLAEKMELSESMVSRYITKLKRLKLIEEVGYDGRDRRLRTLKENWFKRSEDSKKELCASMRSQRAQTCEVRERKSAIPSSIYIEQDKEVVCVDPPPVAASPPVCPESGPVAPPSGIKKIFIKAIEGEDIALSKEELIAQCISWRKDWSIPEIEELYEILAKYEAPVRNFLRFCESTVENIRCRNKIKNLKLKGKKCKTTNSPPTKSSKMQSENGSEKTSETAMHVKRFPLANWKSMIPL